MSYARWGEDGSQVYVFATNWVDRDNKGRVRDQWVCMQCPLENAPGVSHVEGHRSFTADTAAKMLDHLRAHRAAGHVVPQRAFDRLAEEA